jgi:TolA-binding protein
VAGDRSQVGTTGADRVRDGGGPPEADTDLQAHVRADATTWSARGNLWQVPAILVSIGLIALALHVARGRAPENDFDGAFAEIDAMIAAGALDGARDRLQSIIEPNLADADPAQQSRYHATVADWLAATQEAAAVTVAENSRIIAEHYEEAVARGLVLSPVRLERWAMAEIDLGRLAEAHERLGQLDALTASGTAETDVRLRRNRVLRRLVERGLEREGLAPAEMMTLLEEYRTDERLGAADRAWAVMRLARLRLAQREPQAAVAHLLVDMRRLESEEAALDRAVFGELYVLLARGHYDQGDYDSAAFHLARALELLGSGDLARGEALLALGRIDLVREEPQIAHERFDEVVRDYPGAPFRCAALLARAEARSVIGDHDGALEDYRALVADLAEAEGGAAGGATRDEVAVSLADRHDAALVVGDLPLALSFVDVAERLYAAPDVPIDVVRRIASTSRQIADDIMEEARERARRDGRAGSAGDVAYDALDPQLRHEGIVKYERAAEAFLRQARALTAAPGRDDDWATSLWLAADSHDLAGRTDRAMVHFREYVEGRPLDDPRRSEATFRLAQCHHAQLEMEDAATWYARVIEEHPRSDFGTRSHVPLAECLIALGRVADAERVLLDVVDGRRADEIPLTPEAIDYRRALFALGRLYHDTDRHVPAIERLEGAVERYPGAEGVTEARYLLADSYARHAAELRGGAAAPELSPAERRRREEQAQRELAVAMTLFAQVADEYAARDERRLNRVQIDWQRFAIFARADCAYELGRFEEAAQLYDLAARRYSDHHASMQALVKIINCYDQLGDARSADVAHRNALTRLRQLPDDAFDDPQALMDRAAWEQWLRSRPLGSAALSASASPSSP